MTGALIALGFFAVIVVFVGGPLLWALRQSRPRPGDTKLVLLAVAAGEAEVDIWTRALGGAGIRCHVRGVGNLAVPEFTSTGSAGRYSYQFEVWVRPKDEARAREVLGL
jgi:hypothetical protein